MPVLSSPPAENSRPTRKYCLLIMQSVRLAASTSHGSDSERHSGEMMLARVGTCTHVPYLALPYLYLGTLFTACLCIRPSTLASQQLDSTLPSSFRLPSIQYSRNIRIITLGTYLIMSKFESYQVGTYRTECCTTRSRYAAQCLALCCQQYQYIPYISQSDAAFSFHTSHELANSEFLSILIDKLASSALPSFSACLHDDAYPHLLIVHRNAMLCN